MKINEDNMFYMMSKHQIRTVQSLGQNFLRDKNTALKIIGAANLTKDDLVIEVGMGAGSLSKLIAPQCKQLVGIEIDKRLLPLLNETLSDFTNIDIIHQDVLKIDIIKDILEKYSEFSSYKVIANLPYYITTAVIMKFIQCDKPPLVSVLMMQKEVADRIIAGPGSKTYGGLSVIVNYYCETKRVMNVNPNCFVPKPNVTSTVLQFNKHENHKVTTKDRQFFFKVIKSAFAQRRKKLSNSVANTLDTGILKGEIESILESMGLASDIRAEKLSIEEFARLSDFIYKKSIK